MPRVDFTESITSHETRLKQVRKGARTSDANVISSMLEEIADYDCPLVLAVYGTKEDGKVGDYFLRECRSFLVYKGHKYKAMEEHREREKRQAEIERERKVRIDRIKSQLQPKRRAEEEEGRDFDRQAAEALRKNIEDQIGKEAEAILVTFCGSCSPCREMDIPIFSQPIFCPGCGTKAVEIAEFHTDNV